LPVRLIVMHPKQNIESELKWQTCSGALPIEVSCSSGIGLKFHHRISVSWCTAEAI
jgi:hypothetical protein